jgi:hypothetical protein
MEFIRTILLTIEADAKCNGMISNVLKELDARSLAQTNYHITRSIDGLVEGKTSPPQVPGNAGVRFQIG